MKLKSYKKKVKACRTVKDIAIVIGLLGIMYLIGIEGGIKNEEITLEEGLQQTWIGAAFILFAFAGWKISNYIEHRTSFTRHDYERTKK